ncbi:MAG: hypothetical protein KA153_05385 [Hyphomonadaceae bacterium]|nr:hypothetical protein [Hyphomonadaceae bacterium]
MSEDEAAAPQDVEALELIAAKAAPQTEIVETPEAFLTGVSASLKASENVDVGLAAILTEHLLAITPHTNAVANAKAAITALAADRAANADEQADG